MTGPVVDGVVKWFNPDKGFGFIELADGSGDAFLHAATLEAAGHRSVAQGARLKVRVRPGQKGLQVGELLEVDESTATATPDRGGGGYGAGPGAGGARPPRASRPSGPSVEMSGTVKWYNPQKGFGFVAVGDGGKDVFVHASVLTRAGLTELAEGQRVTMQVVEGMKGREASSLELS
jgi:CspA family cold shock protein